MLGKQALFTLFYQLKADFHSRLQVHRMQP